ncbi:EscD/YscD/HrpQ family type III secretion system inner membrane ring protein [Bordetella sputigena]
MTQDLELRVLTGIHQGAKCPAQDGALIGSDGRCDIVLCDEGIADEAARLWLGPETWSIRSPLEPRDTPDALETVSECPDIRFGMALRLGPVLLSIAHASSPWPVPDEFPAILHSTITTDADRAGPGSTDHPAAPADETADPTQSDGGQAVAGMSVAQGAGGFDKQAYRRPKGSGLRWAVGGLLVLLVFGSVASFPPSKVPPTTQVQTGRPPDPETLVRAQQLLAEQGYAPRVRASASANQEVVVTGWVRDEMEHDRLATTLSSVWPLPAMRVAKETQIAERMRMHLRDMDVHAGIAHLPAGDLEIRGVAGSDGVRQEVYRRWRDDPSALVFPVPVTLSLAAELSESFNKAVAAAGLPAMTSIWEDKAFHIRPGTLDASQRKQLQAVLDALNGLYMGAVRVDVDPAQAAGSAPFRVQTVVGGKQPWVLLEDGTRIVIGGTHGAYRLTSVEDGSVVFDGPTPTVIAR